MILLIVMMTIIVMIFLCSLGVSGEVRLGGRQGRFAVLLLPQAIHRHPQRHHLRHGGVLRPWPAADRGAAPPPPPPHHRLHPPLCHLPPTPRQEEEFKECKITNEYQWHRWLFKGELTSSQSWLWKREDSETVKVMALSLTWWSWQCVFMWMSGTRYNSSHFAMVSYQAFDILSCWVLYLLSNKNLIVWFYYLFQQWSTKFLQIFILVVPIRQWIFIPPEQKILSLREKVMTQNSENN